MAGKGYLIGEDFAGKLRTTVSKVLGDVGESQPLSLGVRFEDGGSSASTGGLKLAAFTGTSVWVRMQPRQIFFMDTNTNVTTVLPIVISERTATAVASMFSIPGVTSTSTIATALVTVAKMNGTWQVIAAAGGA